MKWIIRAVVLCALVAGAIIGLPKPHKAAAQNDGFYITTSPTTLRLSGDPGQTVTSEIRIKNNALKTERLKSKVLKFNASGETGQADIMEPSEGDDYIKWLSLSPTSFDAPSNEWITVKITIDIPQTAGLGYYYAIAFSRDEIQETPGQKAVLVGSPATLLLLNVPSANEKRLLEITELKSSRRWYEFLPATFGVKVKNSGNIHVAPQGTLFISRGKKTVATIDINAAGGNVLPNSSRSFSTNWSEGFPLYVDKIIDDKPVTNKKGEAERNLTWDFSKVSKLRFGKYTAHILMVYNDGVRDVPLQATVTFWVIPWRIIGMIVLVLVFVIIGIWSSSRGTWRKIKRRSKKAKNHDTKSDEATDE